MERMKIEIEKSEYDRLKSREEKLMAYYEWFVDKENDLVTVEDIVNKNIELEKENKNLKLIQETNEKQIQNDIKERDELREENKKLKSDLEQFSEAYKRYRDFEKEELAESCYDLDKENKKLREEVEVWKNANKKLRMHDAKMEYENKKLREELSAYDREYFDENKKANTIFMEEDTLQELRDIGEL